MRKTFRCDVPEGSHVYADQAYHDDAIEDVWREASQMRRSPMRQKHAKRPLPPSIASGPHDSRQRIETVGRVMERLRPKSMHAVTAEGVELNVFLLVLAYRLNCL